MDENEVVLSDVHISTPFHTLSQSEPHSCVAYPQFNRRVVQSGVPAELQNLAVSRFHVSAAQSLAVGGLSTGSGAQCVNFHQGINSGCLIVNTAGSVPPDTTGQSCSSEGKRSSAEKGGRDINESQSGTTLDLEEGGKTGVKKPRLCEPVNPNLEKQTHSLTAAVEDEEGDLLVQRKLQSDTSNTCVITIVHHLATQRGDVGHQVWLGALLLCEYIIGHPALFTDQVALDLGAGVGLTSIVTAMFAKQVFCTDVLSSVLRLAEHNVAVNSPQLLRAEGPALVKVRRLDWMRDWELPLTTDQEPEDEFSWTNTDIEKVQSAKMLIAADGKCA